MKNNLIYCSGKNINLPHNGAIKGPFFEGPNPLVGGGLGRLPNHGDAWNHKKSTFPESDAGKSIFLQVDGVMSFAMV